MKQPISRGTCLRGDSNTCISIDICAHFLLVCGMGSRTFNEYCLRARNRENDSFGPGQTCLADDLFLFMHNAHTRTQHFPSFFVPAWAISFWSFSLCPFFGAHDGCVQFCVCRAQESKLHMFLATSKTDWANRIENKKSHKNSGLLVIKSGSFVFIHLEIALVLALMRYSGVCLMSRREFIEWTQKRQQQPPERSANQNEQIDRAERMTVENGRTRSFYSSLAIRTHLDRLRAERKTELRRSSLHIHHGLCACSLVLIVDCRETGFPLDGFQSEVRACLCGCVVGIWMVTQTTLRNA